MIQRFETFVMAITEIYKSIQKIKSQEMSDIGLKGTHVMCLFFLQEHPKGLTSAQLTTLCYEDKAAISRVIKELLQLDCIQCDEKKYRSKITLTETGKKVTSVMQDKIIQSVGLAGQGYSKQEREIFYKVLLQIADNLKNRVESESL